MVDEIEIKFSSIIEKIIAKPVVYRAMIKTSGV